MGLLNRVPALDRLNSWGMTMDLKCSLCMAVDESRNHIFAGCDFSKGIWMRIFGLYNIQRIPGDWFNELHWLLIEL